MKKLCFAILLFCGTAFAQHMTASNINGTCVVLGTLAQAVTCAGSTGVIEVPSIIPVPAMTGNITIPSGVTLKFDGGASCITTTGFTLTINGPLIAPSNGQLFCGSGTISGLGEVRPGWFPGADIGAQINAAAASCVAGSQCRITIPPSAQLSFSTGIVFVANETLECVRHGITTNDSSGDTVSILKYTGSGTAITMGTDNGRFVGCDLLLGSSATEGVHIGGSHAYSNHIEDASIREGGTGTTLVHISCPGGFCEDNHVAHSRINDFVGKGVSIDNANDTFLYQNTAYGRAAGNTTSIALLIDSGAGGININNFLAGSAGLHGLVIQHTLAGLFPHFILAHDFESDNAGGDGWLFDSSLQSSNLDATFLDSWAAGSAEAGIHISGGSGITIGGGSRIRVNQHDGILIDVTAAQAEYGTTIADSYIQGNNQANGGFNGISITGHPGPVVIHGNHINNFPEVGGLQQYAVAVTGDVEGLIFSDNDCAQNVTGCLNAPSVIGTKLTYFGNMAPSLGQQPNYFPGGLLTNAASSFFASGTTAMPIGALGANTCSSAVTVATAGVTTAMRIHWNLHSTPVAVNGYGNSPVTINAWLTTGNVNFIQCATTAVTPGAMSVDWVVF